MSNTNRRKRKIPRGFGLTGSSHSIEELSEWIGQASRNGFEEVQIQVLWNPIGAGELARIGEALKAANLRCPSVGVYSDLLQPQSSHLFDTTERELRQIIEWSAEISARSVVAWGGSFNDDLLGSDPRNTSAEARKMVSANVDALVPLLRRRNVQLLIEPWYTHVLQSEEELYRFCASRRDTVGVVVDVPNLIRPSEWETRDARITSIIERLHPVGGLVHLKDMLVAGDGSFELPYCGKGGIDLDLELSLLKSMWRRVPFMIEHVKTDEDIARATDSVVAAASRCAYDLT